MDKNQPGLNLDGDSFCGEILSNKNSKSNNDKENNFSQPKENRLPTFLRRYVRGFAIASVLINLYFFADSQKPGDEAMNHLAVAGVSLVIYKLSGKNRENYEDR